MPTTYARLNDLRERTSASIIRPCSLPPHPPTLRQISSSKSLNPPNTVSRMRWVSQTTLRRIRESRQVPNRFISNSNAQYLIHLSIYFSAQRTVRDLARRALNFDQPWKSQDPITMGDLYRAVSRPSFTFPFLTASDPLITTGCREGTFPPQVPTQLGYD